MTNFSCDDGSTPAVAPRAPISSSRRVAGGGLLMGAYQNRLIKVRVLDGFFAGTLDWKHSAPIACVVM